MYVIGFYFDDLAFVFFLVSAGYGLKCYFCSSTKSWDDCASSKKEMACTAPLDRCFKLKEDALGKTVYAKGCGASSQCDVVEDMNCCSEDLCNGGKVPMVSAIMLLACALVALLR